MFLKVKDEFDLLDFSPKYIQFLKSPEYLTYLLLKRRIRRRSCDKRINEHLERGDLVAHVSLVELALLQGVSSARVSQNVSELKNKWGVLKTIERTGRKSIFVLGEYLYEDGRRVETSYDAVFIREAEQGRREKEMMEQTEGRKVSLEEFLTRIKVRVKPTLNQSLAGANIRPTLKSIPEGVSGDGIDNGIDNGKDKKDLPSKTFEGTQKISIEKRVKEETLNKEATSLQLWFSQGLSAEQMIAARYPQAYSRFKKKLPPKYNANDLLVLFCIEYYKKYKLMYAPSGNKASPFGGKDSSNLKGILRSQSPEIMVKVIPYFIENFERITHYSDRPSVSILQGWRNTVIPNCLLGEIPEGKLGERGVRGEITDQEWEESARERDDF